MELDHATCYRAVQGRDSRFDGRFFTAVRTTGIYCRPVCPAVTPRAKNVVFYACAAAAEQAGFRPCKRCRPDTAPGTPAWSGTSATVTRALRLIDAGALDDGSVDDLADRLGVGARHLSRLFTRHLGASPVRIAQTRRTHFARQLLEHTNLPVSQVARAAGFGSLRRFNTLIKELFGATPSALRRGAKPGAVHGGLAFRLAVRTPYDGPHLLAYLAGRAIPGVEEVDGATYRRTVRWRGEPGLLSVSLDGPGRLLVRAELAHTDGAVALVERVRRMFDATADPRAIAAHLGRDPLLKPLVERHPGLRLPSAWDPFELAVRTIAGQQISVAAASTVTGRLAARWGTPLSAPAGSLTHLFPEPCVLAATGLDGLDGLGLSHTRAATVARFAAAVAAGELDLSAPLGPDDFIDRLTALRGIGPWTANYVAMRGLGEPDAFPDGDLGLRKAAPGLTAADSARWRPWRAYAALHLWASLEKDTP
ncbi:MAG: DNA-3-methyladenine glycosylase 2 family protein [bacterium]|nr:DNA-3-methyladenine glycosylase 2 family protein [bacterium]